MPILTQQYIEDISVWVAMCGLQLTEIRVPAAVLTNYNQEMFAMAPPVIANPLYQLHDLPDTVYLTPHQEDDFDYATDNFTLIMSSKTALIPPMPEYEPYVVE